ncbi:amino acid ABC transporter substrate-binding protein [Aestuariirhabdus haliotis]|uniref:amino acid ABC transporter substrate-binding protein n=1 Tax=Aestuariirhabdus haliotis TaxID=2918751 RepID=UPI0020BE6C2E|nr:amino acid ABC transporter substrate-binding protein [Aestuariirhabdus haliotis]MCL6419995.1 amino acid ABC transporter substrate-binding protein [Aestuariirhabdus haliotis]
MTNSALATSHQESIKIGITVSLSGEYKSQGKSLLRGLEMWAKDLNSRGALLGSKVEIVHYDDQSDLQTSAQLYERLVTRDKVDFLVGPYASDLTLAASDVAEKHGIPMVSGTAAAEAIWERGYKNIFQVDLPAGRYMDDGLEIGKEVGVERVGILYRDSLFTREVAMGAKKLAEELGMEVVVFSGYSSNTQDFSSMVKDLKNQGAELVLGAAYLSDSIAIVKEAKRQNFSPRAIGFTSGPSLNAFGQTLGADAEGILGFTPWIRAVREPMAFDFDFRYRRLYNEAADSNAAGGYAAGEVLEAAVRLSKTQDRDAVRDQLRKMTFVSVVGRYRVDGSGKQNGKSMYIIQWQGGDRHLVLPERYAEKDSVLFVPWNDR